MSGDRVGDDDTAARIARYEERAERALAEFDINGRSPRFRVLQDVALIAYAAIPPLARRQS